jgi:two-component system NtrC family response regulator
MPPLRERQGDILPLAKTFLQRYSCENNKKIKGFTQKAFYALEVYDWPGNIRELENRIKRAVVMADGLKVTPEDLELTFPHSKYEGRELKEAREAMERELIQKVLSKNKGNMRQAAARLGISRPTLYELMEKLGIRKIKR